MIMKKEAESLKKEAESSKEKLDTINKKLSAYIRENETMKKKASMVNLYYIVALTLNA